MTREPLSLPPRPRWPTPDRAIEESTRSPLDARGIDLRRLPGGTQDAQEAVHAYSQVHAALGMLEDRERRVVVAYACGGSYRGIAKAMKEAGWPVGSSSQVRRIHRPAWERVAARLAELGLCPPVGGT